VCSSDLNVICFQVNMQTKTYCRPMRDDFGSHGHGAVMRTLPKKKAGQCSLARTASPRLSNCSMHARHPVAEHYDVALGHTRLKLNQAALAFPHFDFQCFSGINRRGKAHIEANQTAGVVSAQSLEHRMSG